MSRDNSWSWPGSHAPANVVNDTEAKAVLRDALNGKPGWAIEARRVLGIAQQLECVRPECRVMFPSGGHRRKYCSETCRNIDYKRLAKLLQRPFAELR